MAILHSDFLLGNDTTGNGSAALPYKTIVKSLQMAADGDTVRVAGGQFTQLAGTVTCTARGTSVTTSVNLSSNLAVGDLFAIDTSSVDGFPLQANVFQVGGTVSSTSIPLRSGLHINTPGTFPIYKLDTIHYNTTLSTLTFETASAITANDVKVEGGWDSTFTTQVGWTAVNRNNAGFTTGIVFMSWAGLIKPNIIFNKFLICNALGWTGNNSSFGINEIALSFGNSASASPFPGITTNTGVYADPAIGYVTIYNNGYCSGNAWNSGSNRPTTLDLKQWMSSGNTNSISNIKLGGSSGEGVTAGPQIRTIEAHWKSAGNNPNISTLGPIGGLSLGDIFVEDLTMYVAGATIHPILQEEGNTTAWRYIGNLNVINLDGTRSGITPFASTLNTSAIGAARITPFNLNCTDVQFEQLPWMTYGSPPASRAVITAQSGMLYGKDSTGNQKVIDAESTVRWADTTDYVTGSNSLRIKLLTNTSGVDTVSYMIGTLNKPSTTFTVTLKMKASKNITIGNTSGFLQLQFGPAVGSVANVVPSTTSLGTSWQDITFTLSPSSYSTWNLGDDGLMQVVVPVRTSEVSTPSEVVYLWVDSITVS